jgi:hypothetical protein
MPSVIAKDEVMPLLLQACPSFVEPWKAYSAEPTYEEGLLYIDLGEFAHHLVELMRAGPTSEFAAVFDVVERLHLDGDAYVKEAATIGLLEGIQNVAGNTGVDPERFVPHLKAESAKWWAELDGFWGGNSPYVGAGIKPEE